MKLLTLTGPSCSGKTTLLNDLVANHSFKALVSHTTRPARKGETEGVDYYFVDDRKFDDLKKAGKLMESVEFGGYKYGLSANEVAGAILDNKNPVVIVEPKGLAQITEYANKSGIELVKAFMGGDLKELFKRYLMRSADEDMSDPKVAERHAKRILNMFDEEESWEFILYPVVESQFVSHKSIYDFKISEFNEHTQVMWTESLLRKYNGQS